MVRIHLPPAQSHVRTGLVKGVEVLFVGVIRLVPVTTLKIEATGPATALIPFFFPLRPTLFLTVADIGLQFASGRQPAYRPLPCSRHPHSACRSVYLPAHNSGCRAPPQRASGRALRASRTLAHPFRSLAPHRSRTTGSARPAHA